MTMCRLRSVFLVVLVALPMTRGRADVSSSSPFGFLVKNDATVRATPDSVYNALVRHVDRWWDPSHTFSGDSRNLRLEPRAGGCFCETLPDSGSVRHLNVVYVAPGKLLRMSGALGPLQASGLAGSLTWTFKEQGDSTRIEVKYSVGGYFEGDIEQLAPVVDGVLRAQLLRLKAFTETGDPEPR